MAVRFAFISAQTQQGRTELQLQPGFNPRNCYHCAGSTHYTRSTTDFSRIQLHGGFQDASGPDLDPYVWTGWIMAKGSCGRLPMEDQAVAELWRPRAAQRSVSSFGPREFHAYEPQEGYKPPTSNKGGNGSFSTSMHWRAGGFILHENTLNASLCLLLNALTI